MGKKLIIISGTSSVGKGPMIETLEAYLSSIGRKHKRHVIYTSRECKHNEKQGVTYYYAYLMNVANPQSVVYDKDSSENALKQLQRDRQFKLFRLPTGQLQGIDLLELERDLKSDEEDYLILEIHPQALLNENDMDIISFCKKIQGVEVKKVFISPLRLNEDLADLTQLQARANLIELTVLKKLLKRGRDDIEDCLRRANEAIAEIENACMRATNDTEEIFLYNPVGEDDKSSWDGIKSRVKTTPHIYGKKLFSQRNEVDNSFRRFLEAALPEIINHSCSEELDVCTCRICGNRLH